MLPYKKSLREAVAAPPPSDWAPFGGADDFGKNMGIALAALICSLALAFATGALVRQLLLRRRRQQPLDSTATSEDMEKPAASEPKLAPEETLPVLVFSAEAGLPDAGGGGGASVECAICLLQFADGEALRLLPNCGHGFHVACIDLWIASRRSCPTCRKSWLPPPLTPLPENFGRAGV